MPRLLKIALFTVMAFFGVTLSGAGVHIWFAAHRTTVTFFDKLLAANNGDGVGRCGTPDPLFDGEFIMHRMAAGVVLAFGVSVFCWSIALMKRKSECDAATYAH
jgi:hypothetical protein